MSMNDPIGDMLTRIRNGLMRGKGKVTSPASNLRASVLDVLEAEGYIRGYTRTDHGLSCVAITVVAGICWGAT